MTSLPERLLPLSQSHLLYIHAVTGFEMQIAASRRQLEEQRMIEERWKKMDLERSLNTPQGERETSPQRGAVMKIRGLFMGERRTEEFNADGGE